MTEGILGFYDFNKAYLICNIENIDYVASTSLHEISHLNLTNCSSFGFFTASLKNLSTLLNKKSSSDKLLDCFNLAYKGSLLVQEANAIITQYYNSILAAQESPQSRDIFDVNNLPDIYKEYFQSTYKYISAIKGHPIFLNSFTGWLAQLAMNNDVHIYFRDKELTSNNLTSYITQPQNNPNIRYLALLKVVQNIEQSIFDKVFNNFCNEFNNQTNMVFGKHLDKWLSFKNANPDFSNDAIIQNELEKHVLPILLNSLRFSRLSFDNARTFLDSQAEYFSDIDAEIIRNYEITKADSSYRPLTLNRMRFNIDVPGVGFPSGMSFAAKYMNEFDRRQGLLWIHITENNSGKPIVFGDDKRFTLQPDEYFYQIVHDFHSDGETHQGHLFFSISDKNDICNILIPLSHYYRYPVVFHNMTSHDSIITKTACSDNITIVYYKEFTFDELRNILASNIKEDDLYDIINFNIQEKLYFSVLMPNNKNYAFLFGAMSRLVFSLLSEHITKYLNVNIPSDEFNESLGRFAPYINRYISRIIKYGI